MQSFKLIKIELENYVVFSDLTLEVKEGKHLICGPNGSGKSTLLSDSLFSALYNKNRSRDSVFEKGKKSYVKIHFQSGDDDYVVERTFPDESRRSPIIIKNGEPLNFKKSVLRQAEIEKILGMSFDIFSRIVVVKQGDFNQFGVMTPTVRKTLIEELVGFQVWDQIKKIFSKQAKQIFAETSLHQSNVITHENEMIALNTKINTLKNVQAEKSEKYEDNQLKLNKASKKLTLLKTKLAEFEDKYESKDFSSNIFKLKNKIHILENELVKNKKIVQEKTCVTCSQPFPAAKLASCIQEIKRLKLLSIKLNEKLGDLTKVAEEHKKLTDAISKTKIEYEKYKFKEAEYSTTVDFEQLETDLAKKTDQVNSLKEDFVVSSEKLEHLKFIESMLNPSSNFRTGVLKDQVLEIENLANTIKRTIFPQVKLRLDLTDKGIEFAVHHKDQWRDYGVLSGGEKKRIDIIMLFTFQKFMADYSGLSPSFLVLDEIFDALDLDGVNNVLNTIEILYPEAKSIYVISHKEEIKQAFNSVIRLATGEDGSYIRESSGYES